MGLVKSYRGSQKNTKARSLYKPPINSNAGRYVDPSNAEKLSEQEVSVERMIAKKNLSLFKKKIFDVRGDGGIYRDNVYKIIGDTSAGIMYSYVSRPRKMTFKTARRINQIYKTMGLFDLI